ncbi:hypothetical protein RI129_006412 [Pyrocoelia pectoralis]|uniref:Short-chain dehydrogenase/reductase 3 n=1 Tax=Pyrocoelia pectoralis TaxID=417401 RepID=A0AAN7ZJN6_9COLE
MHNLFLLILLVEPIFILCFCGKRITGAGGGIGQEVALIYASEGAVVVCVDIDEKLNQETVHLIANLGYKKAHAYTCDVGDYFQVIALSKQVEEEVGVVTILINNAGVFVAKTICNIEPTEIEKMISANLMSQFWTVKAFLPSMLKNNYGHIVGIASVLTFASFTFMSSPYTIPYNASKFAVQGLMEGLQNELALSKNCKIKTTVIHPCITDTVLVRLSNIKHSLSFPFCKPKDVARGIVDSQRKELAASIVPNGSCVTLFPLAR